MKESHHGQGPFIRAPGGELAVISRADYERLRDAAEDAADAREADRVIERIERGEGEWIPEEVVDRLLTTESPIRVWREHRGMTIAALAAAAGIAPLYLSQIEAGLREGRVSVLARLADALRVTVDDLIRPRRHIRGATGSRRRAIRRRR